MEKEVKVGDFVRVFQPKPKRGVPFKFHLPWSEPKEVVGIQGVVLTVRDLTSHKTQTVHFDRVSLTLPHRKKEKKRVDAARDGAIASGRSDALSFDEAKSGETDSESEGDCEG